MILGFTGKKQNGKSTVCDMLAEMAESDGVKVARIGFKDPLVAAAKMLGWNGIKDEKGRRGLQLLGTDVVRECFDEEHWLKAWKNTLSEIGFDGDMMAWGRSVLVLTDDVRFDNEAETVRSVWGNIIFIDTPVQNTTLDSHKSEAGIDPKFITREFMDVPFGLPHLRVIANQLFEDYFLPR